ncbi:hypothetical protein LP415_08425 [Polaromonas sp. P1(28)-8]|nr:hypothetical protein LP415_08425 [Polaromonas sp. P1(28)-8]
MAIVTVGIDLAKSVFAVHGVDRSGKPAMVTMTGDSDAAGTGERTSVGAGMDPSRADILPDPIEGEEDDDESSSDVDSDSDFDAAVADVHDLAVDESDDEEDEEKDGSG